MLKDKYTFKYSLGEAMCLKVAIDTLLSDYAKEKLLLASQRMQAKHMSRSLHISLMRDLNIRISKKLAEWKPVVNVQLKQCEALAFTILFLEKKVVFNNQTSQIAETINRDI